MYRVSREGRRTSNDPDTTPPRGQRRVNRYIPAAAAQGGPRSKYSLQNLRVGLGLKVAGVLLALLLVRQVNQALAWKRGDRFLSVEV